MKNGSDYIILYAPAANEFDTVEQIIDYLEYLLSG